MPVFAANLSTMFTHLPFMQRFAAAAEAGFCAVEYLFPYDHPADQIAGELERHGLEQVLFNVSPGDWPGGERGLAALPERFGEFCQGVQTALEYALATGAKRLHVLAGLADPQDELALEHYRRAVSHAARIFAEHDIEVLLEPISDRAMPGYFLNDFSLAKNMIGELGLDNVKLQFDVFHRQIMHGDITGALERLLPLIGHIQIASVPARNEPDGGEVNFPFLFEQLDRLGYKGFVGCEYHPRGDTQQGLGWFAPYARRPEP